MDENNRFPFPEWQVPAQEVLLESDREELTLKVQRAENVISERLQQLQESPRDLYSLRSRDRPKSDRLPTPHGPRVSSGWKRNGMSKLQDESHLHG